MFHPFLIFLTLSIIFLIFWFDFLFEKLNIFGYIIFYFVGMIFFFSGFVEIKNYLFPVTYGDSLYNMFFNIGFFLFYFVAFYLNCEILKEFGKVFRKIVDIYMNWDEIKEKVLK